MTKNFNIIAAVVLTFTAVASAEDDRSIEIQWKTLAPAEGDQYRDPFAKLTREQLQRLGFVVRIQRLIADEKISAEGDAATEAAEISRRLKKQGVDIPWLIAQHERVRDLREQQARAVTKAVAKKLNGESVTLTGYVIPLKVSEGRVTEFFLVPTIAACSHASAPPSNQVVFVSSSKGIDLNDRRTAVTVSGKVDAKQTARTIWRADGPKRITGAYVIVSEKAEVYSLSQSLSNDQSF